jgi:hypothetical protein
MHQRYVSVPADSKLRFARGRRLIIPIARVDVVVDDGVVHLAHDGEELAARLKVGGAHVGRLAAEDVDHGLLDLLHLALDRGRAHRAHVRVRPVRNGKEMLTIWFSFDLVFLLVLLLHVPFSQFMLILGQVLFLAHERKACLPCVASNLV